MARLDPVPREEAAELEDLFTHYEETLSFVPSSLYTMARRPGILRAFAELNTQIWSSGTLPRELKPLIAIISSAAAGCRYCQAHSAVGAREGGVEARKITAVWEFETSPLFSDAERAALRFAQCAATVPNGATDAEFAEMRKFYSEEEIVEILYVVCYFGFLNRWNDSCATELEGDPTRFAEAKLGGSGWQAGKHAASPDK